MPTLLRAPWLVWSGRTALAATFWTLHRSLRTAQCVLYTHRFGWELCLLGEHAFPRSHVCRTIDEVSDTRDEWKATLVWDGWAVANVAR
jgi:hypothetical protein